MSEAWTTGLIGVLLTAALGMFGWIVLTTNDHSVQLSGVTVKVDDMGRGGWHGQPVVG